MKAIIAAGGSGTRLRPLTFSSNKHLLPVANKPLLLYPLEAVVAVGIKDIGVVVNETRPAVEALLGNGDRWGVNITYIDQPKPLGLAHVVKICEAYLEGERFVYHLGDNIFTQGIKRPFNRFCQEKANALLTMVEHPENFRLGVPFFNDQGKLIKVVEKPDKPPNKFGIPGLYFFDHHVFEAFSGSEAIKPSARGELEITDLYTYLIKAGYEVIAEEVEGRWMDPGKFDDMLSANDYLLKETVKPENKGLVDQKTEVSGQVYLGDGVTVKQSRLVGPVSVESGSWLTNCVVGPSVSIAENCRLDGVTIKNSIVMQESCLAGNEKIICDSLIGKKAEVKLSQKNDCHLFIGDHCKVVV